MNLAINLTRYTSFLFIYFLIFASLSLIYFYKISPVFGGQNFGISINILKLFESIIILVLFTIFLPRKVDKPSDFLIHLQMLFPILPMLTLYWIANEPREYMYIILISVLLIIFICENLKLKPIKSNFFTLDSFQFLLLSFSLIVILLIISSGGGSNINFDINRVYENRSDAAESINPIFGYLNPIISKVILPLSLVLSLYTKNSFFAITAFLFLLLFFGLTSHRSILFYPVVVTAIFLLCKFKKSIHLLLLAYFLLIAISFLSSYFLDEVNLISSLIIRRAYFIPANLNFIYFDFFSQNDYLFWAESRISLGLVSTPYSVDISNLIGSQYYNSIETNANTGWLGSGYMNAGFIGIFFYSFLIGIILSYINSYSKFIDNRILIAISTPIIMQLFTSSDLPTTMLNHGFIVLLFLLLFFRTKKYNQNK